MQGYGLSEVTNFSCLASPDLDAAEYCAGCWTAAEPRSVQAFRIRKSKFTINGLLTLPGVEGEIVIRGHCTISGYLHNPAATEAMFRGGWVHTGDLGYYLPDAEGRKHFHVCGRTQRNRKARRRDGQPP